MVFNICVANALSPYIKYTAYDYIKHESVTNGLLGYNLDVLKCACVNWSSQTHIQSNYFFVFCIYL